jgi:regulator of sirC expression with transglutaminase-like and TPR domain
MTVLQGPKGTLARLAALDDTAIDPAEGALALAALEYPLRDRGRYRAMLAEMAETVDEMAGGEQTAQAMAEALADGLAGRHRLTGDDRDEDDLQNANLMEVLDRRRGLPVSLGILWLDVGRRLGWTIEALAFPAHFLVRLTDAAGQRVILDPYGRGRQLDAADMRELLKGASGLAAELEPGHFTALGGREVLLRLQNLVKLRHLRLGQLRRAAEAVEAMLLFAPDQINLWRESGLMQLRQGNLAAAVAALEEFVRRAPNSTARHRTSALLQELRERL